MTFKFERYPDKIVIYEKIFFVFIPFIYCLSYDDCLTILCEYCTDNNCHKAIVLDPDGPNKKMIIKYSKDKRIKQRYFLIEYTAYNQTLFQKIYSYLYYITKNLKTYEKVIYSFICNVLLHILFNGTRRKHN